MKLAYFSPLNPQPSGISDYSEELLPYLAAHAEIDLFVDGFQPRNQELLARFRWFNYQDDPKTLECLPQYDAIVYHLGNDHRYHTGIARVMKEHPGVVVFHDFALQDFVLGQARDQNDMGIYLDELEACHGTSERARAEEFIRRGSVPPQVNSPLAFPLNARLARTAEGIIVHSQWSRERFSEIATRVPVAHINHHITARAAASPVIRKQGASDRRVIIASFGLITPDKGIERALRALATLREECRFHYTLVGPAESFPELPALVRRYQLEDEVSITGYVSLKEFERRIAETDIAINLRERPVGSTSGSLCRLMAAGVPAIVSNVGAFAELPDGAVIKIDPDRYADALLKAYLRKLIEDRSLRERIGGNARNYVLANHDIGTSAAKYVAFIREVIARRPRKLLLDNIAEELSVLGVRANDDALLRSVASEVNVLAPAGDFGTGTATARERPMSSPAAFDQLKTLAKGNGSPPPSKSDAKSAGRLPKLEGIDYKRAALAYPHMLDAERSHYLKTKPFYNLANKPAKHLGDGMDAETHRHFCDFANMAVALALPAGARILDVGCGSGWLSEYFARLGYEVTGIDISNDLVSMAYERVLTIPYNVDHETPLHCRFLTHDIEIEPLAEKFDAIICYDSLHHFEEEQAVFRHLATMLDMGGLLFILEGHKPSAGSATEDELRDVMRQYGTLESPFSDDYLRSLIDEHGFAIVGDYVSVNGLFEREMLDQDSDSDGPRIPLRTLDTDYHYLTCMKVAEGAPAASVPDSRAPRALRAEFTMRASLPQRVQPGAKLQVPITIKNAGDTIWLSGQTVRAGIVMPGITIRDTIGKIVTEVHGQPMLPRAVAPGQSIALNIQCAAPIKPGTYTVKIDLVDQHICWFEERGSQPLAFSFEVENSGA